jgi:hypothetical protein
MKEKDLIQGFSQKIYCENRERYAFCGKSTQRSGRSETPAGELFGVTAKLASKFRRQEA